MNNEIFTPLPEDQLATLELRQAAYHEAGHRALYRRYGGDGDAYIWKNTSGDPYEKAWIGHFRPRTCPQAMHELAKIHGQPRADLPDNWRVLYGMAGMVAEEILRGDILDIDRIYENICERIYNGDGSVSDLSSMNITNIVDFELLHEDVAMAWNHLTAEWPLVTQEAEYLIEEALR